MLMRVIQYFALAACAHMNPVGQFRCSIDQTRIEKITFVRARNKILARTIRSASRKVTADGRPMSRVRSEFSKADSNALPIRRSPAPCAAHLEAASPLSGLQCVPSGTERRSMRRRDGLAHFMSSAQGCASPKSALTRHRNRVRHRFSCLRLLNSVLEKAMATIPLPMGPSRC